MSEVNKTLKTKQQEKTLETEVKQFASFLPYWAKFLAEKILSGNAVSNNDIDTSYSYLLEHLKLKRKTEKPEIEIDYNIENSGNYKSDLLLTKLEKVEGVNALAENQTIEFSPNLTIIYGANGSGKSGYVRLFKNVFYSKAPETILPNIHINSEHKSINAKFTFKSNNTDILFAFSEKGNAEFKQFAVFDGKGLFRQLAEKNEFEFRPAGLSFFADYTNAINRLEQKLNDEIQTKKQGNTANDLSILFDGNSEIKTLVQNLNAETKIEDLKKYTPFSDEDKTQKETLQKQYDELLLASKEKEKTVKNLENIRNLLGQNKQTIEKLNQLFMAEVIEKIKAAISDCVSKEATAKAEGIENFKTEKIQGIGTEEWKNFIVSAEKLAKTQKKDNVAYPENGDNCIFCHQLLSDEAQKLISNYWIFIKSVAEQNAKQAQEKLDEIKKKYANLNFDLFPQNNTLTVWLTENYPNELDALKAKLTEQKTLAQTIISDIQNKTATERVALQITVEHLTIIETNIDTQIKILKEDEQSKELEKLLDSKTFLEHKEKFNIHFSKFEAFVNNQIWIKKANKADYAKRKITDTEKALSNKYFNQKYIDTFNEECQKLNGKFGIKIDHTGSAGKSYRQLKLKGKSPNAVLSEGEQKVIAIADFLAEMHLSEVNRGIIFDDPVTSLDNDRKKQIAERLTKEALKKQVIIFTHDLVFVSSLIGHCKDSNIAYDCHWIENRNESPGQIWLNNSPSYEKEYRNAEPAKKHYITCSKDDCEPMQREIAIKQGFAALRTCYEVLVINDLFNNVVQRYNERVSIDALSKVSFDDTLINELLSCYAQCCRFMEGHSHSDRYSYLKPEPNDLNKEIQSYELIKKKIKDTKKDKAKH
jgi:energy-coupling factor transporter ATP-binding protein EcfA2